MAAQGEGQVQRGPSKITARFTEKTESTPLLRPTLLKRRNHLATHTFSHWVRVSPQGAEDQEPLKEAATLRPGNGFRSQLPPLLSEPVSSPEKWEYK